MSTVSSPRYPFLSKPPQLKQKKRKPVPPVNVPIPLPVAIAVNEPSPTPARSFASITLWAQAVQPGSPPPRTPPSPYRNIRRASVSSLRRARRGSITHTRASSGSFLQLIDTPTTSSAKETTFDLTNLGYTSVFVPVPKTPVTPKTPSKSKLSLKRIRSLGVLRPLRTGRPRSRSTTSSNPPASPKAKSKAKSNVKATLPPTLANELLLLQFMDGGSLETNMKRVMKKQAKRAAKAKGSNAEPAVDDVHRDGNGGVWMDQAEEMEYKPLLAENEDKEWVQFEESEVPQPEAPVAAPSNITTDGFDDSFTPDGKTATTKKWAIFSKN